MSAWALLKATFDQGNPPAAKFTEKDVPDLSGKVVIITGGNTGIGKDTARVVLAHNAKVYIACRSEEKALIAIKDLKELTGKSDVHFLSLDLTSLDAVRKSVEEFNTKENKLDVLFNNAGVMWPAVDLLTQDGYDMTFGTNLIGPYLFTTLLMPLLTAAGSKSGDARIVNTSSLVHMQEPSPPIYWETLKPGDKGSPGDKIRHQKGAEMLYSQSKRAMILISNEWARRYRSQGIVSISLHPGVIQSDLTRHWGSTKLFITKLFIKFWPAELGAITQLYAGTAPEAKDLGGKYLIPWARVGTPTKEVLDEELGEKLWNWLEEETAVSAK